MQNQPDPETVLADFLETMVGAFKLGLEDGGHPDGVPFACYIPADGIRYGTHTFPGFLPPEGITVEIHLGDTHRVRT